MTYPECSIEGCERPGRARTWCFVHYGRWRHHGDPNVKMQRHRGTVPERFWKRVQKGAGCWEWTGSLCAAGYGQFTDGDKSLKSHRVAYELTLGPIPEGMMLDHRCRNRRCVNPGHLRPATYKQNRENLGGAQRNSKTGVQGVHRAAKDGVYVATVGHNGKLVNGGRFKTLEEAAEAAKQLRLSLFTHNDVDRKAS